MLRAMGVASGVAVAVHAGVYRWRLTRARLAERQRLPAGDDGIVLGAEPVHLHGSASHAALLVHGFGDTPQTVRQLAEYLHGTHGWTVRAPLLPGHGRSLDAFDASGAAQWRTAVHREYAALCATYPKVVLVGLSMGGALVTLEAADAPALPALVLLAPYLTPPARAERLAPLAGVLNLLSPYLRGGDREKSIFDPTARARVLGYSASPPKRVRDLVSVAHDARFAAAAVRAPTLLVHSRTDYRIPAELAARHPGYFSGAALVDMDWVDGAGHVITVDYGCERVWARTAEFLALHAGAPRAAERTGAPGG
jgi:carboxylesterase